MRFFDKYGVPDNDANFLKTDIEALDYLFLGNYIDWGWNSLEVICTLFALKLKFPKGINLLRGSHEDILVNWYEGFGLECTERLKEDINNPKSIFMKINEVFNYLSLAAIIDDNIFCLHSGIGTHLNNVSELN